MDEYTKFLESEFKAMDEDEDGLLSRREVYEILIYQGVEMTKEETEKQLKTLKGPVDLDIFIRFMKNLPNRTRKLREIFAIFSGNETSMEATKEGVLLGLEQLGVQQKKKLLEEMTNSDDLVTYKDFVRLYFKAKDFLS